MTRPARARRREAQRAPCARGAGTPLRRPPASRGGAGTAGRRPGAAVCAAGVVMMPPTRPCLETAESWSRRWRAAPGAARGPAATRRHGGPTLTTTAAGRQVNSFRRTKDAAIRVARHLKPATPWRRPAAIRVPRLGTASAPATAPRIATRKRDMRLGYDIMDSDTS